jgi:DNA-binding CsgD family transcriptional regulator
MARTAGVIAGRPIVTIRSYEIHVRGELRDDVLPELAGLQATVEEPQTVLRGSIRDQAALHGILVRLQERLGIELVEMRQFPDEIPFMGRATVELVVTGALGDVAMGAFGDTALERRQVLVTSAADTFDALDRLTARGVEVLAVRERPVPEELARCVHMSGEAATGPKRGPQGGVPPRHCQRPGGTATTQQPGQYFEPLTDKEREVLGHLSELLTTGEIASAMFISVNTVRTHVRNILRKLAASRRNEAVRRARALELIPS